ncbi:MAG TPA: cellulose binding domain-containing protein, partial [Bacillota bacterium]|nr:cellulose binding domain-containing protein [Bacillota bacterium]
CGNLWRTTTDISDNWSSVCKIIDLNQQWAKYAGPGQWNDPDMLEVGNGGMTDTEYRTHFSMWCMMAAPLITGNDLRNMSQATLKILTNREVIAVDQDPAGIQGTRVVDNGDLEVWCKPLGSANGSSKAVALFNRGGATSTITVNWSDIGITGSASVRDLWDQEDRGTYNGSYSATVPSHGVVLLKIVQNSATTPTPTPTVSQTWVPYVPSATQVALTADPENRLMHVDLTFPDGGYRIVSEGDVAVAAGINPDGSTYLSNLTSGVRIEKYTGYSSAVVTTKRITYQIYYGDTTYFAFQVSGAKVKDITIAKTPTSPTPTLPTFTPSPTPTVTADTGITVSYVIQTDWGSGATVNVTIKNNGTTAVNGWTLAWNFSGNQTISNLWNGVLSQSGTTVTVKNASYNAIVAANGGTVSFGFNLNYSGKYAKPGEFTLNDKACQVQ